MVPTFWTGLGAIRRDAFEAAGGFLSDWENIEDVELGLKVTANGGRIQLDPRIKGKHLKDWSVGSMIKTDMLGRAVPWTRLLKSGRMPLGVLSTSPGKRVSAVAVAGIGLSCLAGLFWSPAWIVALAALAVFVAANADFLKFLAQTNGTLFALSALPFHIMHHVAAILGYAKVTVLERPDRV